MPDRHVKIIIDTNLWISFLIGLKASPTVRSVPSQVCPLFCA